MIIMVKSNEPFMVMDYSIGQAHNRLAQHFKALFRDVIAKTFSCV